MSRILVAGALPGSAAGNSVSTTALLEAVEVLGETAVLSHRTALLPTFSEDGTSGQRHILLGTQPLVVHGEAFLAARLHRRRLRGWDCAWAVNSRYAAALSVAGIPYAIWEPTTLRDELDTIPIAEVRRSGAGSGLGAMLHKALLPVGERMERRLYHTAAALYAMSEYTRGRLIGTHGLDPSHVRVLAHPPSRAFLRALAARTSVREEGRGAREGLRLLFVGRVGDPRKNFALFAQVVQALRAAGVDARGTAVGPFSARWRQAFAGEAGPHLRLAGRVTVDELVDAYLSHDLLLVTSRQEGFGIVVAEALHSGLPVVATTCGGPEAMVGQSGAGVLVGHTTEDFVMVIRELVAQPGKLAAMRAAAVTYAAAELSFEKFSATVAAATAQMLSPGR